MGIGLCGIDFVEFSSPDPDRLEQLFLEFGFSKLLRHKTRPVDLFVQNGITFFLNRDGSSYAGAFHRSHGPSISSMGWKFKNIDADHALAVSRGGENCAEGDYTDQQGRPLKALYGIGRSLIYFMPDSSHTTRFAEMGFVPHPSPITRESKGFQLIDHLTNNVAKGEMNRWSEFYRNVFEFTEVRYFDIRGVKTGLQSYALRSPCGTFCIPINEGTEAKSQINEYLEEYKGPGVQHLAFLSDDIVSSVQKLKGTSISTLDIDNEYYQEVFHRVPNVTEDHRKLQDLQILVDGDDEGYLLQIFTKNLVGPIFVEIIQRKNHLSFGEGNFGALFRSIERDQQKRGYLSN